MSMSIAGVVTLTLQGPHINMNIRARAAVYMRFKSFCIGTYLSIVVYTNLISDKYKYIVADSRDIVDLFNY